jgi:phage/plasmid-like protein (TIGR03299 family)
MPYRNFWQQGRLTHLEGKHFNSFDEVMSVCELDFTAEKVELVHPYDIEEHGKKETAYLSQPFTSCIRRADDQYPLGTVGTIYGLTQYREWFSIAEKLWEGGITLVEGGLQNRGQRAYLIMRAGGRIKLADDDYILNEFAVSASHDGSAKLVFMMTPRRTSNETVFNIGAPIISIKHSKHVKTKIDRTENILHSVESHWNDFAATTQKMSMINLTEQEAREFIKAIVGDNESTRSQNIRDKIYDIWKYTGVGRAVPACNGTLFGLVQAFCEYSDHHATVRKSKYLDDTSATLDTKALGNTAKSKAKGWSFALTLMRKRDKLTFASKGI